MAQTWSRVRARVVPKLKQIYRGNQSAYQPVEDIETTNNNSDVYTNNNYSCVNQNALDLPTPDSPSLARLQRWGRNLTGLHGLFTPQPRRYLAVPRTPTLSDRLDTFQAAAIYRASRSCEILITTEAHQLEVGVLQVALVTLGHHIGLLNNWYCLPDHNDKIPPDSVLFPLSRYLVSLVSSLGRQLSSLGTWVALPDWWNSLEMRKLRLRHNIKGLYLYDSQTKEQMLLYKPGTVTMDCHFTRASTIASRLEVWTL